MKDLAKNKNEELITELKSCYQNSFALITYKSSEIPLKSGSLFFLTYSKSNIFKLHN